jgi:hypothetical protein
MDTSTLPPENDYSKIGGKLAWRDLPYKSTLGVTGSYAHLSNDFTTSDLNLTTISGDSNSFSGDIDYTNAAITLASRPTRELDSRIYYKYVDKSNDSSVVNYNGDSNIDNIFEYNTDKAGVDLGYKLPAHTKATAGYEYENTDRTNRQDATSTTDNSLYVQLKNNSLDYLTAKIRYKHLDRTSDSGYDSTDGIDYFIRSFDATDKTQDEVALSLEIYPIDSLDLGLDYKYKTNDYDTDDTLGRTDDTRHEVYADFNWRQSSFFILSGYTGFEKTETESNQYAFKLSNGDSTNILIDDGSGSSYRWSQEEDTTFWTYGLTANVPMPDKNLNIFLSWEYQNSYGNNDFTSAGATTLENIDSIDNYTKKRLEAKAVYAFAEQIDFTLGYVYEKYAFDDLQYDGYDYTPPGSYLSGAYSDQSYETNIAYLTAKYSF